MQTGVYLITNAITGTCYVGSTVTSFKKRFNTHKSKLRNNTHDNSRLQNSWNKYGEDAFTFDTLEECTQDVIYENELFWISYFRSIGADICNFVLDPKRFVLDADARKKISDKAKGRKYPPKTETALRNMSAAQKAAMTPERKMLLSELNSVREYDLVSPDGTEYRRVKSLKAFALSLGLPPLALYPMASGEVFQYKGWRLLENKDAPKPKKRFTEQGRKNMSRAGNENFITSVKKKMKFSSIMSPDGVIYSAESRTQLAKDTDLPRSAVVRLLGGSIKKYAGWTRVPEDATVTD